MIDKLKEQEIIKFDNLFVKAASRQSNLVYLGSNNKPIGFFGRRKLRKSIAEFSKCLKILPNHWQSMFFMAKAHQRLKEHNESFKLLVRAFEIEKGNFSIPMEAAIEALQLGKLDKAIFYSEEALKRKSEDPIVLGNYAVVLLLSSKEIEAEKYIREAIKLDPSNSIFENVLSLIESIISGRRKTPSIEKVIEDGMYQY